MFRLRSAPPNSIATFSPSLPKASWQDTHAITYASYFQLVTTVASRFQHGHTTPSVRAEAFFRLTRDLYSGLTTLRSV